MAGDQRARDILHIHNVIIREQVATCEGFQNKSQGDRFMVVSMSPGHMVSVTDEGVCGSDALDETGGM